MIPRPYFYSVPFFALLLLAACDAPVADETVDLCLVNRASEAMRVIVEESRCLDGAGILNGATILIELPVREARLTRIAGEGCAGQESRLRLSLLHLGGGEIGRVAVTWNDAGRAETSATGEARYGACVSVAREDRDRAPSRLDVVFDRCG